MQTAAAFLLIYQTNCSHFLLGNGMVDRWMMNSVEVDEFFNTSNHRCISLKTLTQLPLQ